VTAIRQRDRAEDLVASVWAALAEVRDPELDEPVTELGFVASCRVSPTGEARIRLRLPTYFCAPNFAFLMVVDAHDAVNAVPGITHTEVTLDDHFAATEINRGVAAQAGFVESFDGLAQSELGQLRADFLRKAVLAATDRVCRPLLDAGRGPEELAGLTLADLPASPGRDRLVARRRQLGLQAGDDSALVIDPATGAPVEAAALALHLRRARLTRVSVEANGEVCRGLLRERYPDRPVELRTPTATTERRSR
jgi:metal-sulfur cluster biosynthetic enzyme